MTDASQTDPAVAMDGAGNFVVAWTNTSNLADGSGAAVYARLFNNGGVALENEFRVNSTTSSGQAFPSVAVDPSGGFVITRTGQDGAASTSVFAQRYTAGGVPLGGEFRVNTTTSSTAQVSERAMYWPASSASWIEAHNSFGLTTIGTKWGLAEGSVGFPPLDVETYILLANPNDTATTVTITYLRTTGSTVVKTYNVPPTSRFNVFVNADVPELSNEEFGAVIEATLPIAVERAVYWNADGVRWASGTNATAARLP